MKNSVYRIALDMHKDASQYTLHAKRYDTARTIRATFTDGGKPFDVSDYYPVLIGKNAKGETLDEVCKIDDNSVVYDFTLVFTQILGLVECEIQLYNKDPKEGGAVMITSARFCVIVSEGVYDDNAIKAETKNAFTQLLGETILAKEEANDAAAEVLRRAEAGEFDGAPGATGDPGEKGEKGDPGEPGKTPVAGVDFFTEADKTEMQDAVLSQIGIKQSASGTALTLRDSSDCKLQAFSIDGGTAGEAVSIEVSGKNLIDPANFHSKVSTGDNWAKVNIGGWTVDIYSGTTRQSTNQDIPAEILPKLPYLTAGWYTLSFSTNQADGFSLYTVNENGVPTVLGELIKSNTANEFKGKRTFELESASRITLRKNGSNSTATIFYDLQLERGTEKTSYEPYRTPQAVTVEATGGKVDVLEQHPGLRSYHHTTVVSNDKGISMNLTYVADTKTYIDNKLTEVAAALL